MPTIAATLAVCLAIALGIALQVRMTGDDGTLRRCAPDELPLVMIGSPSCLSADQAAPTTSRP